MKTILQWIGTAVAILLATIAISMPNGPGSGNTTSSFWDAAQGFKMNGTVVHSATVLKTTTAGGTLTLATSNTATSTAIIGCINTYATSTATAVKLVFGTGAGASSVATTTFGNGTMIGLAGFAYGSCP